MKTVYTASPTSFRSLLFTLVIAFIIAGKAGGQDYTYVRTVGSYGNGAGQLDHPYNIVTDRALNLYVADYSNHRVQVFNAQGEFVYQIGSDGVEPGQLHHPVVVEIGPDGNLCVGHSYGIEIFTTAGQFIRRVPLESGAYGLSFDQAGNAFVSTAFEIEVFSAGFAQHLKTIGEYGKGNGQFNNNHDIVFDREGRMFVTDMFNHRVEVFTANGEYLTQFGTEGSGDGQLWYPTGLAMDGAGFIYILDQGNRRVVVGYFGDDLAWHTVRKFGSLGNGNTQFQANIDVVLDRTGAIYVSDITAGHVKVFSKLPNEVLDAGDITKTYGDQDFVLHATNKEAPEFGVAFEVAEDPANTGNISITHTDGVYKAKILQAGQVKIRAITPDDPQHSTAVKDITLTINKAAQQITFNALDAHVFGEAAFTISATASSGQPVGFETSNPAIAAITGQTVSLKGPGTVTITAVQPGNENYLAAAPVAQPLEVSAITGTTYEEKNSIRIYPVPAHNIVTVNAPFTTAVTPVTLCDMQGRAVRHITPTVIDAQTRQVDIADLPPGIYLLQLNDYKNSIHRLVKN